jgi:cysteinyl-tRNA synthetase
VFRLYDTRTRQVEAIEPRGGLLRMFSCGPPVDRPAHLGHLRTNLLDDLIRRNAERRHHLTVLSAQSIADAGHVTGTDAVLARKHEDAFGADCSALNLRPIDQPLRASESIALMTGMIARLIESGHAHAAPDGSVYFEARSFPGYGDLSGHEPAGDWALWHAAPEAGAPEAGAPEAAAPEAAAPEAAAPEGGEPAWPAPLGASWGAGFPGWATECSALALHHLGEVIDIHTGGVDLRFPHHENERAQSNSLTGREVVRHWVHGEHLLFDGRQIATSAGNAVFLDDVTVRELDPLALRLAFLEHHYRQQMNLTWDTLGAADRALRRWRELVAEWASSSSKPMCAEVTSEIAAAFDGDLDTPAALRTLRTLELDPEIPPGSKFETFAHADQLLGLDLARDIGRAPVRPA